MRFTCCSLLAVAVVSTTILVPSAKAQLAKAPGGDWPLYRHDAAGTGYSPLAQITTRNVSGLVQAWTFRLQSDTSASAKNGPGRGRSNHHFVGYIKRNPTRQFRSGAGFITKDSGCNFSRPE
jgi:hypothetical protein